MAYQDFLFKGKGEKNGKGYLKFVNRSCPINNGCIRVEPKKYCILSKNIQFIESELPPEMINKNIISYLIKKNE